MNLAEIRNSSKFVRSLTSGKNLPGPQYRDILQVQATRGALRGWRHGNVFESYHDMNEFSDGVFFLHRGMTIWSLPEMRPIVPAKSLELMSEEQGCHGRQKYPGM